MQKFFAFQHRLVHIVQFNKPGFLAFEQHIKYQMEIVIYCFSSSLCSTERNIRLLTRLYREISMQKALWQISIQWQYFEMVRCYCRCKYMKIHCLCGLSTLFSVRGYFLPWHINGASIYWASQAQYMWFLSTFVSFHLSVPLSSHTENRYGKPLELRFYRVFLCVWVLKNCRLRKISISRSYNQFLVMFALLALALLYIITKSSLPWLFHKVWKL